MIPTDAINNDLKAALLNAGFGKTKVISFVAPPANNRSVYFGDQHKQVIFTYVYNHEYPNSMALSEILLDNCGNYSSLNYLFVEKGGTLWTVKEFTGDAANSRSYSVLEHQYPYIMLPSKIHKPIFWTYLFLDHFPVHCSSELRHINLDGLECDQLVVKRIMDTSIDTVTRKITITETYIRGLGIQDRTFHHREENILHHKRREIK